MNSNIRLVFTSLLLLFIIVLSHETFAQTTETFTSSGTWVCPDGVTSVQVEAWGGGAGGRSAAGGGKGVAGAGGGSGAYAKRNSITVVPGTSYVFTIGAGGTTATGSTSTAGGNTTATINGVTITAVGGSSPDAAADGVTNGGIGGAAGSCVGDVVYSGGDGGDSWGSAGGAGSGYGGGGAGGAGSTGAGGAGGNASSGGGGAAGTGTANNGGNGGVGGNPTGGTASATGYGGGGGGGYRDTGGNGRTGAMIFTYTCPVNNAAAAGSDQTLDACATTATLAGNTPDYGTGTWTVISGPATITTANSPTSGITGLDLDNTATLEWTIDNEGCGSTSDQVDIITSTGVGCWSYCEPNSTGTGYPITNVTFAGINNSVANPAIDYEDFTGTVSPASVLRSVTYPISIGANGLNPNPFYCIVFFDWNNDGDFVDAGESFQIGTSTSTSITYSGNILIPAGATLGTTRMRVMHMYNAYATSCYNGAANLQVEDYFVTIIGAPTITVQPTNQTMCYNGSADFTVEASGAGTLTYQWQYGGVDVVNGTPANAVYENSTSATMTVSGTIADGAYTPYTCVVTNAYGNATSNGVQLTVTADVAPDAPTDLTASPQYLCSGSSTLSATLSGTGTLQWHSASCDGTLETSPVSPTTTTTYYAREYDGGTGCYSACSEITVGVMDDPVIITNPTSTNYGCDGVPITFSIVATGAGLTYQWQEDNGGGYADITDGGVYSGATTTSLTISNPLVPMDLDGYTYRCVVTGDCASANSTAATLNVLSSGLSGTYDIPADYATLKAAFDDINSFGLVGDVYLRVGASITDNNEASLNQWNSCSGAGYTVTIYPTGAARTLDGSVATSLVTLNGADYVTFDGRIDMTGAPNSLILSNTNTSGSTIKYIADATYNTVKYCTLQGVSTALTTGVVWFSTATTTGNDNNTITYCNIGNGTTTPAICVYASGTADKQNDDNVISYSNIYNFYKNLSANMGISINTGNTRWTINNNSFYQTTSRTDCATYILDISNSDGEEFNVHDNYFGGQAANCGGGAMTYSSATVEGADLYMMFLNVSNTGESNVYNNTIKNISWTGIPDYDNVGLSSNAVFTAVGQLGRVNIYNNTIGDNSTGSITLTLNDHPSTADYGFIPIIFKLGNGKILNNTLGSITINGTVNDLSNVYGIYVTGAVTNDMLIDGNIIGNETTSNSIQTASGLTPRLSFSGIYFGTGGSYVSSVTNNIISNISNNCTSATAYTVGIRNNGTGGTQSIVGNTISNISVSSTRTGYYSTITDYAALTGIINTNTTTGGALINNNRIHSLSGTGSAGFSLFGICHFGPTSSTNYIDRNNIHSFNSTYSSSYMTGIIQNAGDIIVSNNMIRLGIDASGASVNTDIFIYGIEKNTTANNVFYHNSVYLGGNNTGAAKSTYCFKRWSTGNDIFKNNILYNARTGASDKNYAIAINATTTFTSDYNDLLSSDASNLGSYDGGTTARTFATWKTGTSQDANSLNVDPTFANATGNASAVDLHLINDAAPVIDKATAGTGILVDFDGQQRKTGPTPPVGDGNDPCIGADERIIPPSAENSYGIYMPETQSSGNIIDCEMYATGGTPGGYGILVANPNDAYYANVGISSYQVITQENIQCMNTDIDFTTETGSPDWLLGNGSSPSSGATTPITTQYTSTGRKDIIEDVKVFTDFTNITMDTPDEGTILGAPAGAGCPTTYNYTSSEAGSAGYSYSWSATAPGGCAATIASPTSSSTDITFVNTTGSDQIFILHLNIETECCGPLTQVDRYITIYPGPLPPRVSGSPFTICTGGSQNLSITVPDGTYSYDWYDAATAGTLLGSGTTYSVATVASGSTSYFVEATNQYGCPSDRTEVIVEGDDTPAPTVTTPVNVCGSNDAVLSITPTAGYTYSWYSGSCGGTLLQTGTSSVYTTVISADMTVYVSNTPPGCGASACSSIFLDHFAPPDPIVWLGVDDGPADDGLNNWFQTTNWTDGCLPTCETNVNIPVTANDPDIGLNATAAECKNINLQNGVVLSFSDVGSELYICGDFTHAGTLTTNDKGRVVFSGADQSQTYTKTGAGNFNNVSINNTFTTPTVTIGGANDMTLASSGKLLLINGKVVTGTNNVVVTNIAVNSVLGHSTASYINGNLKRYINAAGGVYDFPVGKIDSYQLLNLDISSTTGLNDITVRFDNPADATGTGLPLDDVSAPATNNYSEILNNGDPGGNGGVWTVTPDAGSADYDLTLYGRNYDNSKNSHTIVTRADAGSAWSFGGTSYDSQSNSGGVIMAKRTGFSGFSQKAIVGSEWFLPMELKYLESVCNGNEIIVYWATFTEKDNNYFIVERSYDAENWTLVAKVEGSGNSYVEKNYSIIDEESHPGLVYYRLIQVDFSGMSSFSNVISNSCNKDEEDVRVFSYSNGHHIIVDIYSIEGNVYDLVFTDYLGKILYKKNKTIENTHERIQIPIENLAAGVYNIIFMSEDAIHHSRVVVSQ